MLPMCKFLISKSLVNIFLDDFAFQRKGNMRSFDYQKRVPSTL